MLKKERQAYIIQQINVHNKVLSSDLSVQLDVSEDTVRRDLQELAEEGKLIKVHGGALSRSFHFTLESHSIYSLPEKKSIAYKGSKVHRSLSWSNVNKKLISNEQDRNNNAFSTIAVGDRENSKETSRVVRTTDSNWKDNSAKSEHNVGENEEDLKRRRKKRRRF